jgi:hypothetical protein
MVLPLRSNGVVMTLLSTTRPWLVPVPCPQWKLSTSTPRAMPVAMGVEPYIARSRSSLSMRDIA